MPAEAGSDVSQRVMRAAKQLFFARGFANTPLRAIAKEAGTSESGVLRIYHSKTGLLRAVYAECWAELNVLIEKALVAATKRDSDPRNLLDSADADRPGALSGRPTPDELHAQ